MYFVFAILFAYLLHSGSVYMCKNIVKEFWVSVTPNFPDVSAKVEVIN